MEDGEVNGAGHLDLGKLRQTLLSNSTKQRSTEIENLTERISKDGRSASIYHQIVFHEGSLIHCLEQT